MSQDLQLTNYGPNKDVRVSHRSLAEYMGLRQDAIRETIEKYIAQFEQISQCPFEMENARVVPEHT
jgi:phage regulator Rha-like protein